MCLIKVANIILKIYGDHDKRQPYQNVYMSSSVYIRIEFTYIQPYAFIYEVM